jgi:hypothetical protein
MYGQSRFLLVAALSVEAARFCLRHRLCRARALLALSCRKAPYLRYQISLTALNQLHQDPEVPPSPGKLLNGRTLVASTRRQLDHLRSIRASEGQFDAESADIRPSATALRCGNKPGSVPSSHRSCRAHLTAGAQRAAHSRREDTARLRVIQEGVTDDPLS